MIRYKTVLNFEMVVKKKKPGTWFRFQPSNTCQSLSLKICSSLLRNTKIQNKSHKLNILRARIHNNTITQKTATEDGIMYTLPQGYIFYLWPKLSQPRKKEKTKTTHAGVNWAKKKKKHWQDGVSELCMMILLHSLWFVPSIHYYFTKWKFKSSLSFSVTYWKTTLQGLKLAHIWWKMNSNFKPEMNGMNSGSDKCIRINSQEYENPLTKCIQKIKNAK